MRGNGKHYQPCGIRLVETDYSLVGMRSGRKFRMGDKVTIKVIAANLEKRQLDYEWVLTSVLDDTDKTRSRHEQKLKHKKKRKTE